jgi:hypothetical protein
MLNNQKEPQKYVEEKRKYHKPYKQSEHMQARTHTLNFMLKK